MLDGTYTPGVNGALLANCTSTAHNGSSAAPVTVQALNERQAVILGTGLADTLSVVNCAYWNIVGLHMKQQDAAGGNNISVMNLANDSHLTIRRNLLDHINRCANNNMMLVGPNTSASLIEENELYFFHRWGIILWQGSTGNEIRRNYSNGRGYFTAANSTCSTYGQGSVGAGAYYSNGNTFENNIAENTANGFNVEATSSSNQYLGNIALKSTSVGFQTNPHCDAGDVVGASNITWKHNVGVNNATQGWWMAAVTNGLLDHNSSFHQAYGFRVDPVVSANVCGTQSFTSTNNTAQSNGTGFSVARSPATFSYDHNNTFGNSTNYSPNTNVTNAIAVNPGFGSCYLWPPDASPLKGVGTGGSDVGATILYQYAGGTLTSTKLWDPATGAPLFKGATVSGLNDVGGQSLFDVASRLNINQNGCSFPVAYGGTGTTLPAAPSGLTAVVQ